MSKQRKRNKTVGGNAEYRRSVEIHTQQSMGTDDAPGSYHAVGQQVLDEGCRGRTAPMTRAKGATDTKVGGG
jgi:hypothetical protein